MNLHNLSKQVQEISQRRIQYPVKHLGWEILQKKLSAETCQVFSQETTSKFFDRFLKTPLVVVRSVHIWSFVRSNFPAFGLNTERYGVSLRIQSECWKIKTRKTLNTDTFYALTRSKQVIVSTRGKRLMFAKII